MNRVELIQELINKKKYTKYLEIGSYKGESFFPINCKRKVAVDPKFHIPLKRKLKWIYKNPFNIFNKYCELKSDDFFIEKEQFVKKYCPNIIFIDGLHTFKASLKDVLNSINHLSNDGVIVMHDCLPPNKAGATYANSFIEAGKMNLEGWTGEWTGDVYKTIVYLREKYADKMDIMVLNTDYGLGCITIKEKISDLNIDKVLFEKINKLTYEDLMEDKSMINLKDEAEYTKLL